MSASSGQNKKNLNFAIFLNRKYLKGISSLKTLFWCFPMNIKKFLRTTFFRTIPAAVSGHLHYFLVLL